MSTAKSLRGMIPSMPVSTGRPSGHTTLATALQLTIFSRFCSYLLIIVHIFQDPEAQKILGIYNGFLEKYHLIFL